MKIEWKVKCDGTMDSSLSGLSSRMVLKVGGMVWLRRQQENSLKLLDILVAVGIFVGCCVIVAFRQSPGILFLTLEANWLFVLIAIIGGFLQGIIGNWKVPYQWILLLALWLFIWLNAGLCFLYIFTGMDIDEKWFAGVIRSLSLVVEVIVGTVSMRHQAEK